MFSIFSSSETTKAASSVYSSGLQTKHGRGSASSSAQEAEVMRGRSHTAPDRHRVTDDAPLISSLRVDWLSHSVFHMLGSN